MKRFSKIETKVISAILFVLSVVIVINMQASLRKGRDNIRKNDIYSVEKAIDTFYQKYKFYPESTADGKIVGCFPSGIVYDKITGMPINMEVCEWGKSSFEEIKTLPMDPNSEKGTAYFYKSDGDNYMFYISLEGKSEAEYTESIANLNLQCGVSICNYGRGVTRVKK